MAIAVKNEIEVVGRELLVPALEVAKKFVCKRDGRPALKHVAIMPNGELQATDSHKAIILKNIHSYKESLLLEPKTLDLIRGYNFPALNNISEIREDHLKAKFTLSKEVAIQIVQALKFFKNGKYRTVKLGFAETGLTIESADLELNLKDIEWEKEEVVGGSTIISFQPDLLGDTFEAFVKFSSNDNITIYHHGAMRNFVLDNDEMRLVVLPVRTC